MMRASLTSRSRIFDAGRWVTGEDMSSKSIERSDGSPTPGLAIPGIAHPVSSAMGWQTRAEAGWETDWRTGSNQTALVAGGADSWISTLTVVTPRIIRNNDAVRIARAPARLTATDSAITPAISINSMTTPMQPQCKRAARLLRSHRSVSLHRVCRSSMTLVTPSVSRASAIARSRSALDSTVPLSVTVVP